MMAQKNRKKVTAILLSILLLGAAASCNADEKEKPSNAKTSSSAIGQEQPATSTETQVQSSTPNDAKADNHYPVTIQTYKHSKEAIEEIFEKAPERVYCVNPTSIDNMMALGLEERIAKISLGSRERLTEDGKKLYDKLGGQKETLSKEEVLGNNIDFILGWYSTFDEKALGEVDYWQDKGIKTYIALNSSIKKPAPNTLEDEYQDIRNLGNIFHVEDRAEALISQMDKAIEKAQEKVKEKGKVRTIILEVEKDNQLRLYGPSTIGGVIGEKVGADLLTDLPRITGEELISLNPDVIFSVYFGPDSKLTKENCITLLTDNPALQSISAVQNKKIYPITLSYTYATGARTLDAIYYVAKKLHPGFEP